MEDLAVHQEQEEMVEVVMELLQEVEDIMVLQIRVEEVVVTMVPEAPVSSLSDTS